MSSQADINSVNYDAAVAARDAAMFAGSPHVVLKPRIFPDGDMWCVILGEDLQTGVCGFGETPVKACLAFDQAWHHSKTPDAALAATRQSAQAGAGNGVRDALERLHLSIKALGKFEGKATLFEANPSESDAALAAWQELDAAQKQAAAMLAAPIGTGNGEDGHA